MQTIQFSEFGDPIAVAEVCDVADPGQPGSEEVLVETLASPIDPADIFILQGQYGRLPKLPAVPGIEGVGRVIQVGEGVKHLASGDQVMLPAYGNWCEQRRIAETELLKLPPHGDPKQLSMLRVNPPTAYLLVHEIAALNSGDWLIQNAANSAVGRYIIQLAGLAGIRTVNLVRREELRAELSDIGADAVLMDSEPDLPARIREITGGALPAYGIDAVGGDGTLLLAGCLAAGGVIVNYGVMSGKACKLSAEQLIFRDIRLSGFWLARWFEKNPQRAQPLYSRLATMIAEGRLRAKIDRAYPLAEIKSALQSAIRGGRNGKIILDFAKR